MSITELGHKNSFPSMEAKSQIKAVIPDPEKIREGFSAWSRVQRSKFPHTRHGFNKPKRYK